MSQGQCFGAVNVPPLSTLIAVVTFSGVKVAESLNRGLGKVSEWCDIKNHSLNL